MEKRARSRWLVVVCLALAGCGGGNTGGGDGAAPLGVDEVRQREASGRYTNAAGSTAPSETLGGREAAQSVPPPDPVPPDANVKGMWSPVYSWPVITVHTALLPDGRVMSYGTRESGQQTGYFEYDLWDNAGAPNTGHRTLANGTGTDIFCSSQLLLNSGSLFIAGGDNWTGSGTTNTGNNNSNVFDTASDTLARGANMNRARWYSSSVTLINGETYIQGGSGGTDRPEVRQSNGTFRLLSSADTSVLNFMYPRNFIAPDGRVFGYDSAGRMYYVNAGGTGSIAMAGQFGSAYRGNDASAAMFRPGRILQFGGASNGAIVIDITGGSPVVTPTQSMASQRRLATATILADGQVLATGGSSVWNEMTNVAYAAEIWNPQTGQWTPGPAGVRARLYHSSALLLPDASVLVSGGGAPGPQNNLNAEVYYPPYLFAAGGVRAARPSIVLAPTALTIGQTFNVDVSSASSISRVVLVKTGSVTHGWNMEQRFVELTFVATGSKLAVQSPTKAVDAPPGFYHLFVFDAAGVPSVSQILRIGVATVPNPQIVPVVSNPGAQSGTAGTPASLQVQASDPNGDTLRYAASGLPPGLAIDATTGLISGTPSSAGSFDVVVTASDSVNAASAAFVWSIDNGSSFEFVSLPTPSPAPVGNAVAYDASASGSGVQYRWNFGDGSPTTPWSTSGATSHAYAQPGIYSVTVSASDSFGSLISRSFLQIVHLPPTAQAPTASSNLAVHTPASGNPRLWVVNPDNDSVSVFDTATRAKLREVAVGQAPRALAIAADGNVWVSNKQGASISVIDQVSESLARTIALPRGAAPYGVAMSPAGDAAYVVLEAGGQLLRFDTASFAQTGSVAIGPNARHVSVSADGASVYVTRFVTPPLPGENTVNVLTGASVGAQVLLVDAASMALTRTIVLQHSDQPDFENQGRGVPNYLGAATISPDGTQAWLPSKQDNVKRGQLREGSALNFQNTVRAISSRIALASNIEQLDARIDHDNASVASAAAFDRLGVFLFVALETSREVAVLDAHGRGQLLRFDVGRAPQGLALSADGKTLYVHYFMDRCVGLFDLRPLVERGEANLPALATLQAVASERLAANVLRGKQFFYDARDTRLARDRYMSCASCHNDGGHDGRVWDLASVGEGLRNTIALRGRAGAQGRLHWSHNFDEVQDFEGQIRNLAGGTGLMSDADFNAGTRSQPLGDAKAGFSADLDALAAYVASLDRFDASPQRPSAASLSAAAQQGRTVFADHNCAGCHGGSAFTLSGSVTPPSIGTIKPSSGQRLGGPLAGIDIPTLRDVWLSAPYLHDGSAPTLEAAVQAHRDTAISAADVGVLAAYLRELGGDEASPAVRSANGSGAGLLGSYYNNTTLTGTPVLTRTEAIDFDWGTRAPEPRVGKDRFSVRWSGFVEAPYSGAYTFRTVSDEGVRVSVGGVRVIDDWSAHTATTDTSGVVQLVAGQRYAIGVDYYDSTGKALIRLLWKPPGVADYAVVPRAQLYAQ